MKPVFLILCLAAELFAADVLVRDSAALRRAIAQAEPGTRILLAPGEYNGGLHFANVRGAPNRPIAIAAAEPAKAPVIRGGANGLHLSSPAFVEVQHLVFTGWSANGVSVDDGGALDTPARGVVLRGLIVTNTGPRGNRDAIKLSGVADFRVEQCDVAGWGIGGGSGIDMVGCHRGLIRSNSFRHTDEAGSTGVQCKGGTSEVVIQRNRFDNAGNRGVNIGGSTGRAYFRPPLRESSGNAEARDIRVEGNTFIGSAAAVAFVGVDGAIVRFNTIYRPKRWALRILQETRTPDFVPSRRGEFTDNLVVFDGQWSEGGVNIGSGTAPETFRFARNWRYCLDRPERSRPRLPTTEQDGVYGRAVEFRDAALGDLRLATPNATLLGAEAWRD